MRAQALFAIFLLIALSSSAQNSSCTNSDFEQGTLDGWTGRTGYCCPINTAVNGMVASRHTLMTGTDTDPYTCNNVTVVAPGGTYSARLGNFFTGGEAESLSYSLNVTSTNTLFIYKYAVVLEDPGHEEYEQPRFQLRVLNSSGQLIDPTCGQYTVAAAENLEGFQTCETNGTIIRYRDWTTVGLNLEPYLGQNIILEFSTGDCSLGGHFGYAYVDAYCSPLAISANYCSGSFSAELTAPIGFVQYQWNTGETTRSIYVNNPIQGQTYTCTMTSVTGCTVDISTALNQADPIADFAIVNTCFNNAEFSNTTFTPDGLTMNAFTWDFGDGTTSNEENPTHSFPASGTYNVSFTAGNNNGCGSFISHPITVVVPPTAAISYDAAAYCSSQTSIEPVQFSGTGAYLGGVFTSSIGLALDMDTGSINPSLSTPGQYVVSYQIPTTVDNCTVPAVTANVSITPSPTATISYPNTTYCQSDAIQSATLSGTGSYTGGVYTSTAGLSLNSSTGAINPTASDGGDYTVTYTVPAIGGCEAIPVTTNVQINPLPDANIEDGRICIDQFGNVFQTVLFDTGLNNAQYDFVWYLNNVEIPDATSATYLATALGTYTVIATNSATGCISPVSLAIISETTTPSDFFMTLSNVFTSQATITVTVIGGSGPFVYQMDDNAPQESNVFSNLTPGPHLVHVTDIFGCTDITKEVIVMDYPRFFTPNGDGFHDHWNLLYLDSQPDAKIYLYDRFGKLIKQISPLQEGWDGTYNGLLMPSTDYWFTVDYKTFDRAGKEQWQRFNSHFSLKR